MPCHYLSKIWKNFLKTEKCHFVGGNESLRGGKLPLSKYGENDTFGLYTSFVLLISVKRHRVFFWYTFPRKYNEKKNKTKFNHIVNFLLVPKHFVIKKMDT